MTVETELMTLGGTVEIMTKTKPPGLDGLQIETGDEKDEAHQEGAILGTE